MQWSAPWTPVQREEYEGRGIHVQADEIHGEPLPGGREQTNDTPSLHTYLHFNIDTYTRL
jgi:hypothetical protein